MKQVSSRLIPTTMEMNARTWMLQLWQQEFPGGATIDTVARWCVASQESVARSVSVSQKNADYQRVYMLSIELANMGLLYTSGPGAPPSFKPIAAWYEINNPPSPEEIPTP